MMKEHCDLQWPLLLSFVLQGITKLRTMKGLFLVEPVVALYAFSSFLIYPLVQQYVYRRFWEQLTNSTYPAADNTSRCLENSSQSRYHEVC